MKSVAFIFAPAFLFGCGLSLSTESDQSFPRVNTLLGEIEGYYKTSSNGRKFEAYEGVPYAQPPIGDSRFRVARSISPWLGVLMAKQFGPPCMQVNVMGLQNNKNVKGSEDCLYLNIYTPISSDDHGGVNGERTNLLPVIFYIYGGAFQFGNAANYGPKYLLNKNVTLVTMNYRLGALGFLSTEDAIVPGNMGLKDQVIALRWVKENIESFGGDPSRITIIGQSAGGASVHYHYLTNLTAGLFQGGMSLSGTALNCWAQAENSLEKTQKLSTTVGCSTDNIEEMIDCLRSRPAHQIVEAASQLASWLNGPHVPFAPVIEKGGDEFTFIDRPPVEIITSGDAHDLPWITSVVSEEGLCPVAPHIALDLQELNNNWETIAPNLLEFNHKVPKTEQQVIARLIRQHYLGTSPIDKSTVNQTVQMIGDRMFVYDAEKAARLQAKTNQSPVRFHYFSYRGAHSMTEIIIGSSKNLGVSHGDDHRYILASDFDSTTIPEDRDMQETLINLWVSFATDGTPDVGVEWPEVRGTTDEFCYLNIAGPSDIRIIENDRNFGEKNFWQSLGLRENVYNDTTTDKVRNHEN